MDTPVVPVILAGGEASRYGGLPKGLELVGGKRILDHLVDVCVEACGRSPLLVANAPDAWSWRPELRVVADAEPGLGALGGILTAIRSGPAPVIVVAWDMPFVTADLLRALVAGLATCDAFLPESGGRRKVEPLCAGYGPACGPAIEASLARGDRRAIAFHEGVRVGILQQDRIRAFGDPARLFFNVNTPEDLVRAQREA